MLDTEVLKNATFFCTLDSSSLAPLASEGRQTTYNRGEMILAAEETRDRLFLFLSGSARLYRISPTGHEVTIVSLNTGDVFGLALLVPMVLVEGILEATEDGTTVGTVPLRTLRQTMRAISKQRPMMAVR
jgi:CRP-like cAMP-binding protein